jgi:hypothetical protein
MSIEKFIEDRIAKAMAEGEFDNLPGKGRPVDLDAYFKTPEDLRVCYSLLKDGNFVPEEVQLLKDVEQLREQLDACSDDVERERIQRSIREKSLTVRTLLENQRRRR